MLDAMPGDLAMMNECVKFLSRDTFFNRHGNSACLAAHFVTNATMENPTPGVVKRPKFR